MKKLFYRLCCCFFPKRSQPVKQLFLMLHQNGDPIFQIVGHGF